jgi:MFS family permease
MSQTDLPTASTTDPDVRRRRAIRGAFFGFLIDSFDIYLPSIALLPAMVYFTRGLDAGQTAIVTGVTLAATLIGRPVGSILFGFFADRIGRKRTGAIAIYGFSIVTLLIAVLPGAQVLGGTLAITLLLALRFIDGIFLGGEYTAATPMATEYAKVDRRGLVGGMIQSGSTIGYWAIALFTYLALLIAPASDIDSPYVQWGWRIPFVLGAIFAYVTARYLRRDVEESVIWENSEREKNPIAKLFTRENGISFVLVFVLMTGIFFMVNMVGSVLPQLVIVQKGFTPTLFTITLIFSNILVPFAYWLSGRLSDSFGRKPILISAGILIIVVQGALFALLGTAQLGLPLTILVVFLIEAINGYAIGTLPSFINERFPTPVRSSGWGIGYSLAVVIPGFFAFYQAGLATFMPMTLTATVLVVFGGILIIVATALSPETRGADLTATSMRQPRLLKAARPSKESAAAA